MCDDCMDRQAEMYQEEIALLVEGIEDAIDHLAAPNDPGTVHVTHAILRGALKRWREVTV